MRLCAIGIDAAETSLIRRAIDSMDVPHLAALAGSSRWLRVDSPAHVGSGAVWPTFSTGNPPVEHGLFADWAWNPSTMGLQRARWNHLVPFWKTFAEHGFRCCVLDVPFAPPVEHPLVLQVLDWGAHDWHGGHRVTSPSIRRLVEQSGRHPFRRRVTEVAGPEDHSGIRRLIADCREGIRRRGDLIVSLLRAEPCDLMLAVFTEIHRASHHLWHTAEEGSDNPDGLLSLLRELDDQLGRIVDAIGPEPNIVLFSLHGMRPTGGIPVLLAPLLEHLGYARPAASADHSSREQLGVVAARAKRLVPQSLKRLYYRIMPPAVTFRLAQPLLFGPWDWSRTRAFPLPSDQHGWIRINLEGRERDGIVPRNQYQSIRTDLQSLILSLDNEQGEPLVRSVEFPADHPDHPLPDLIVHWTPAAEEPLRLRAFSVESSPVGTKFTGQHADEGFLLVPLTASSDPKGDSVDAERIQALFRAILSSSRIPIEQP